MADPSIIGAGSVIDTARNIMAVMSPATGTRASGLVTVKAEAGETAIIPRSAYAFPIIAKDRRPQLVVKAAANPAEDDGHWEIDDTGGDITMISNLGGDHYNLPADTPIVFDPPIENLIVTGADRPKVKAATPWTGGLDPTTFAHAKDVVLYEHLRTGEITHDVRRSGIKGFPAVIITWNDLQSADGVTVPQGDRGNRVGTRSTLYKATYDIAVLVSRENEDHARRHQGAALVDFLFRLLTDRQAVDGVCLSNPSGLQVLQVFRETAIPQALYQKFYIYHLIVSAEIGVEQIDDRTFNDWLLAVIDIEKPQKPALPSQGDFTLVDDMEVDMS